jgi:hypothetical protein
MRPMPSPTKPCFKAGWKTELLACGVYIVFRLNWK